MCWMCQIKIGPIELQCLLWSTISTSMWMRHPCFAGFVYSIPFDDGIPRCIVWVIAFQTIHPICDLHHTLHQSWWLNRYGICARKVLISISTVAWSLRLYHDFLTIRHAKLTHSGSMAYQLDALTDSLVLPILIAPQNETADAPPQTEVLHFLCIPS